MKDKKLISIATPLVIYASLKILSNYRLYKTEKSKTIDDVKITSNQKLKTTKIDKNYLGSKDFKEQIEIFIKRMKKNFSKKDLTFFYNNIDNLRVNYMDIYEPDPIGYGTYIVGYNSIYMDYNICNEDNQKHHIYHELFHMASSYDENENYFCGFDQYITRDDKTYRMCYGLNEGYTQLMAERYFGDLGDTTLIYPFEKDVARRIELLVGKDKMEKLYLHADLKSLIERLKKFAKEEDIIKFINNMDSIYSSKYIDGKKFSFNKICLIKNVREVCEFLLDTYLNGLKMMKEKNLISDEDFISSFINYSSTFKYDVFVNFRDIDTIPLAPKDIIENKIAEAINYIENNKKLEIKE